MARRDPSPPEAPDRAELGRLLRSAVRRDRVEPAWIQIRDRVREAITSGVAPVGSQLPGEPELAQLTRAGRPTVRQALDALRRDGWIVVHRGRGTFVAARRPPLSLLGFEGLTRTLADRGFPVTTTTLGTSTVDEMALDVLGETVEGPLFVLDRLRALDDGTPLILERDALPLDRFPDAEELLARHGSVGSLMQEGYGQSIHHGRVGTRAIRAGASARLLGVTRGAPVLEMERLNVGFDGEVLHAVRFLIRTDVVPLIEEVVNPT